MSDSDFNTPPDFLDLVRRLDTRGRIGLDPCSNSTSFVNAVTSYTKLENGLAHTWRGHGLVFMNPPHSFSPNNIEPWMAKAWREFLDPQWEHREEDLQDQFLGLIPAKTDTEWFHEHAKYFPGKCFLRGRMKFWQNGHVTEQTGKFAQLVIYAGPKRNLFDVHFRAQGWIP